MTSAEPGVRTFVVHSDERLAYERQMRERDMARTRVALERLARRVATGRLRTPEKIAEAAARIPPGSVDFHRLTKPVLMSNMG